MGFDQKNRDLSISFTRVIVGLKSCGIKSIFLSAVLLFEVGNSVESGLKRYDQPQLRLIFLGLWSAES